MRKVAVLFFVIAVIATIAAACGVPAAPSSINVSLTTYGIKPSSNTAKAGDVTFKVKNDAADLVHEFVVVKTDTAAGKLPMTADGQKADEEKTTAVDEIEDIEPGKSGELKVTLAAGHYVLLCNVEGHYAGGMYADLNVVP
jgi:uncharacterized cupredoxin-like copper-binding protein